MASSSLTPSRRLLDWYDLHRRELPWRLDRDPYRVWVSEVMLQQTRVETVLPYYERFLERFPDVAALAGAEVEELLALWSGLGYYRRARQMHAAAQRVMEVHGGRFPETTEGLLDLPGIGPYTAAAVGSICFGVVEPVMDGNVERVMARLLALDADPKATAPRRLLVAAAADLLDPQRPGDGNQALMELGATVCVPRSPRCLLCPLREPGPASPGGWEHGDGDGEGGGRFPGCRAVAEGEPEAYPPPRKRRKAKQERRVVALVRGPQGEAGPRLLLFRRPDDSALLAGTWELPWVEVPEVPKSPDGSAANDEFDPEAALAERYGATWSLGSEVATVKHGITHRSITITLHHATLTTDGEIAEPRNRLEPGWFNLPDLADLPLSSMVTKSLKAAGIG